MIVVYLLAGFVLGAIAMAIYSLTHGSQVAKLGADVMGELAKIKEKVGIK